MGILRYPRHAQLAVFFGQPPIFPAETFIPHHLPGRPATPGRHNFRLPGLKAIIPLENLVASDF